VTDIIWCTPGRPDEPELLVDAGAHGFTVIRRCLDVAELIAAAGIDRHAGLVIDVSAPRLSADTLAHVASDQRCVVAYLADSDDDLTRAESISRVAPGMVVDIRRAKSPSSVIDLIQAAIDASADNPGEEGLDTVPSGALPIDDESRDTTTGVDAQRGKLVVVWGPHGAPGRSTVALGLAESCAASGYRTCLVDADTISPSLALLIGMTEDVSGLLVAARYAEQGVLDARSLGAACRALSESLWVLSGIGSADRWSQARPSALDLIWAECTRHFDRVIVDVGGLLRTEEVDDPFNGLGLRRDCAAVGALQVCDSVVAVTRPDVVGLARLVEDLPDVLALTSHLRVDVVVNQVSRRSRGVESNVKRLINEVGLDFPVHPLAFDDGVRTCVERGSLFSEASSLSRMRRNFGTIDKHVDVQLSA
jgi:MinD-like ATPase involved in chromosome partitioning or flagellar assembly